MDPHTCVIYHYDIVLPTIQYTMLPFSMVFYQKHSTLTSLTDKEPLLRFAKVYFWLRQIYNWRMFFRLGIYVEQASSRVAITGLNGFPTLCIFTLP